MTEKVCAKKPTKSVSGFCRFFFVISKNNCIFAVENGSWVESVDR